MNKAVLGIDLGTSSVKVMLRYQCGDIIKEKEVYEELTPKGWINAVKKAIKRLNVNDISAIGLSSQVGTYITDRGDVINWDQNIGGDELKWLKDKYSKEEFMDEILMTHPDIISYPLPRILYIHKYFPDTKTICQPKDLLYKALTGNLVTDQYSWRGMSNLNKKKYSKKFVDELSLTNIRLPEIFDFSAMAGVTKDCEFLPDGIPVYVGLNDFYASLLGMGITNIGDMFDITGTSEHIGIIEGKTRVDTAMVSSPYLFENVHYGVTASSGASISFGMSLSENIDIEKALCNNPPIFLPYLNGERAPIWDADARGTMLGISSKNDKSDLAYAIFEGVVFSIYHIYEHMSISECRGIRVSGGASKNTALNRLKAELFDAPIVTLEENDTSALGACVVAAFGEKWYGSIKETINAFCKEKEIIKPKGDLHSVLKKRFEIYKSIYPAIKDIKIGGKL